MILKKVMGPEHLVVAKITLNCAEVLRSQVRTAVVSYTYTLHLLASWILPLCSVVLGTTLQLLSMTVIPNFNCIPDSVAFA